MRSSYCGQPVNQSARCDAELVAPERGLLAAFQIWHAFIESAVNVSNSWYYKNFKVFLYNVVQQYQIQSAIYLAHDDKYHQY